MWYGSKFKNSRFYLKKSVRENLDEELLKIRPPDSTMRVPRSLKDLKFIKGNEVEELFLHYFPILLRNKLPKEYYDHFLLGTYATKYMTNRKIYDREIDHAEELYNLFVEGFAPLYGKNKVTYNIHITTHLTEYVRMYGPFSDWCCYFYDDFNGYVKDRIHDKNKIDAEVVNTLKICNAYKVLKHLIQVMSIPKKERATILKGREWKSLEIHEHEIISQHYEARDIDRNLVHCFIRASIKGETFTSEKYKRQKLRDNSLIFWYNEENKEKFGQIKLFLKYENEITALVQEIINDTLEPVSNPIIRFRNVHLRIRLSYVHHFISIEKIKGKLIKIRDFVCKPGYVGKK